MGGEQCLAIDHVVVAAEVNHHVGDGIKRLCQVDSHGRHFLYHSCLGEFGERNRRVAVDQGVTAPHRSGPECFRVGHLVVEDATFHFDPRLTSVGGKEALVVRVDNGEIVGKEEVVVSDAIGEEVFEQNRRVNGIQLELRLVAPDVVLVGVSWVAQANLVGQFGNSLKTELDFHRSGSASRDGHDIRDSSVHHPLAVATENHVGKTAHIVSSAGVCQLDGCAHVVHLHPVVGHFYLSGDGE